METRNDELKRELNTHLHVEKIKRKKGINPTNVMVGVFDVLILSNQKKVYFPNLTINVARRDDAGV